MLQAIIPLFSTSKPEIPLWFFIVLVLILAVIIGWIIGFLPERKGRDDGYNDYSDFDFDGDGDYF